MPYSKFSFNLLPHMYPHIRISPFIPMEWEKLLEAKVTSAGRTTDRPSFWLNGGRDLRYFANGRSALLAYLHHLKLKRRDEVLIVKTFDGPYITSCVTKAIEKICRWSQRPSVRTKLVLVIHEFGFPCPEWKVAPFKKNGIPVLEDCAYALGSRVEGAKVGTFGDFALYSLPKYYPIPFGGILASKTKFKSAHEIPLRLSVPEENLLRHTVQAAHPLMRQWNTIRRQNWNRFSYGLAGHGVAPYFPLNKHIVPGVYLMAVPPKFRGEKVKKKLNAAGVESTQYYRQGGFYIPVHQFLTIWEKDYIVENFQQ